MKKGEMAWEYIAAIVLAVFVLVLLLVYSGEIKDVMLKLVDKLFSSFG
tara:strand:+ start:180 stop:323 length:144 start_codon:yes stop_codon:yes gene_type:complete